MDKGKVSNVTDHEKIPVVIFAGGRGARFNADTDERPKPLIEVCGKPILRHIIDSFYAQGFREFIIPYGYLGNKIVGFCIDAQRDDVFVGATFIAHDTGLNSHVGERLLRCKDLITGRRFVMTYGDGLCDVDMARLIDYHQHHCNRRNAKEDAPPLMTVTAVHPPGRFGLLEFETMAWHTEDNDYVVKIREKLPQEDWINGGFMVVDPGFFGYLETDGKIRQLESQAMLKCARDGRLIGYKHYGFWRCMDTRRDLEQIQQDVVLNGGAFPWMPKTPASGAW